MIAIVNYKVGNIGSVANMLRKIGSEVKCTNDPKELAKANKILLPGVGAFDAAMHELTSSGLIPILRELIEVQKKPLLGICLGAQLLGNRSEEGNMAGLGWIDMNTIHFKANSGVKIPHMGWNVVEPVNNNSLFKNKEQENRFYFAHSYHFSCNNKSNILASATHGYSFPVAVHHENIFGVQFHPEKSHKFGLQLLKNFVEM